VKGDTEILKGAGALSKQEVGKMLSKALKVSPLFFFYFPGSSCALLFSYPLLVKSR
jgi:hypothetical protein